MSHFSHIGADSALQHSDAESLDEKRLNTPPVVPLGLHHRSYNPFYDDDDKQFSRSAAALQRYAAGYMENGCCGADFWVPTDSAQHQYTAGFDPDLSRQTTEVDWWNWLVQTGLAPTSQCLQGDDDSLAGDESDWQDPGIPSPAIANNLAWLSPMQPPQYVARNIAKASAHIARRDPQSYSFVSQSLCCKYLPKCMLQEGPLPSLEQTQEYLCHELGLPPDSTISLALNEKLRTSGRARTQTWCLNARVACILAIWGSDPKALTTHELLQALIDNIPYCYKNRHHAVIRYAGAKRKDWAATVLYQLSRSRIFVLKTPDGQPSKHWRIDVRGADYVTRRCSHMPRNC